ncbi:TPA: conjugal transfer protein TraH [Vibrio vulnificus]|nr:conjugal transfer protein TraH [Vibrio vulnificus]
MKIKTVVALLAAMHLTTASTASYGGVADDMDKFFGGAVNYTSPGVSKGQMGGMYNGGSLSFRTPSNSMNPISVSLPSFSGGCNGIDAFMGAFSHISSEQLVALGKAIASNAASFAFDLAVATLSPAIHNQYEKLRELANMVNQMQINSCEQAAGLVAQAWPFEANKEVTSSVCQTIGRRRGFFTDGAAEKYQCDNKGKGPSVASQGRSDPDFKDVMKDNTNSTWAALNKSGLVSDTEMKELVMTLVGSIIKRAPVGGNDSGKYNYLTPKATDETYLDAFLYGTTTPLKVHKCNDSSNCLDVAQLGRSVTIPKDKSFKQQVSKMIEELMVIAASQNRALEPRHIAFLDRTTLPIYKMILVDVAYSRGGSVTNPEGYAEVVALDYFYNYLDRLIESAVQAVNEDNSSVKDSALDQWRHDISAVQDKLKFKVSQAKENVNVYTQMMQKTMQLERMLASDVTNQVISSLDYSKQW